MSVMSPADYCPNRSLPAKLKRRMTQWRVSERLGTLPHSMITFSFDDFPKSAADTGAEIMDMINAPAIYYACSGLAGQTNLTGELYDETDLVALEAAGHEIGAHTHTHLDCATAPLQTVLDDIQQNLDVLKEMGAKCPIRHFAYPYGETTVPLKRELQSKFETCRGILPGQNQKQGDRLQLRAMELTPDEDTKNRALAAIETAIRSETWLHIFTHDVRVTPSPFGTTPCALKQVAKAARDSGIQVITPSNAIKLIAGDVV